MEVFVQSACNDHKINVFMIAIDDVTAQLIHAKAFSCISARYD
jgi:hypothetical protein